MDTKTDTAPAAAPKGAVTAPVTLASPIKRGDTEIASLTLRKPRAGELRGLNLNELLNADVTSIIRVVPRISDPSLTEQEVENLEADDLAEVGGVIFGFFMNQTQKAALAKLTG